MKIFAGHINFKKNVPNEHVNQMPKCQALPLNSNQSKNEHINYFALEQSGAKPNLVAKILAIKIGNLWA